MITEADLLILVLKHDEISQSLIDDVIELLAGDEDAAYQWISDQIPRLWTVRENDNIRFRILCYKMRRVVEVSDEKPEQRIARLLKQTKQ